MHDYQYICVYKYMNQHQLFRSPSSRDDDAEHSCFLARPLAEPLDEMHFPPSPNEHYSKSSHWR
jgi:hypothetical protein